MGYCHWDSTLTCGASGHSCALVNYNHTRLLHATFYDAMLCFLVCLKHSCHIRKNEWVKTTSLVTMYVIALFLLIKKHTGCCLKGTSQYECSLYCEILWEPSWIFQIMFCSCDYSWAPLRLGPLVTSLFIDSLVRETVQFNYSMVYCNDIKESHHLNKQLHIIA